MGSANARGSYIVISSLISWTYTQYDPKLTTTKLKRRKGIACVEHFIHFVAQYICSKLENICSYDFILMSLVRDWWTNFDSKTYTQWSIFVTSRKKTLNFLGTYSLCVWWGWRYSCRIQVDQYRTHSNSWDICSLRGCFTNDYSLVI